MTNNTHQPYAHIKGVKYGPPYLYPIEPMTNGERDMCGPTARCTDCGCMRMNHVGDGKCNKTRNGKHGREACPCVKFNHPRLQHQRKAQRWKSM